MNEVVILGAIRVLAIITIVVLFYRCLHLEAMVKQRAAEHAQVGAELSVRTQELQELQSQFANRVQQLFVSWRERELESLREQVSKTIFDAARNELQSWKMEVEANIRSDAIKRSSAVVSGKVTEHLTPYIGTFPYNPQDVRFLGAPIDLIVFDGLSEGDLRGIIFLEVKTNTSNLSTRERRIRDVIHAKRVGWQEFRIGT